MTIMKIMLAWPSQPRKQHWAVMKGFERVSIRGKNLFNSKKELVELLISEGYSVKENGEVRKGSKIPRKVKCLLGMHDYESQYVTVAFDMDWADVCKYCGRYQVPIKITGRKWR